MTAPLRLGAFAVALAIVLLGAAALGRAVGPVEREAGRAEHAETAAPAELSVELVAGPSLRYRIVDAAGRPVRQFDVLHARRMHLILVRRDLSHFEHLHPERGVGGTWYMPLALPAAGTYTAFADFSTRGSRQTLEFDLHAATVHGAFTPRPLPPITRTVAVDGYRVTLARSGDRFEFDVRRDGRPVRVARYLGARGHLVALRERDLHYLHVHAEADELAFEADLPSAGRYRLYLQFKAGGAVHTAEFAVRR